MEKASFKPNVSLVPDTPAAPFPAPFAAAVESIRAATMRQELAVTEIPAPGTLAPWSFALAADVTPARHGTDSDLGTGRFVVLYDPASPRPGVDHSG